MGSLPNLHELEHIERRRERRRERELQRARESSRERFAVYAHRKQSSYNAYLMAGLGMTNTGGLSLGVAAAANGANTTATGGATGPLSSTGTTTTALSALSATGGGVGLPPPTLPLPTAQAVGGGALAPSASKHYPYYQPATAQLHHMHHHHHRHSLTNRHRVLRTRSTGATHNIFDEQVLEHLSAYSPISTRSHRINPVSSYQVQAALAASRRRESINSSIGATSIRRLITLNNRSCRHKVPLHLRRKVCKNFTLFTVAHGIMCAILVPLAGLQGSNSLWHHREHWLHVGPNIGSLLLSLMFLLTTGMTLLIPRLIRKFGYTLLVGANYVAVSLFLLCHMYPSIYTLLPAYLLLGFTYSPSWISKIALVVHYGSKLSCSQHECTLTTTSHPPDHNMDEHMLFCNRDQKIRRLARWFHAAQDFGIIIGAVIASVALACTSTDWNCYETEGTKGVSSSSSASTQPTPLFNSSSSMPELLPTPAALHSLSMNFWPHISGYFDDFYNLNDHGIRICGADMCPVWRLGALWRGMDPVTTPTEGDNETIYKEFIKGKATAGGMYLVGIYFVFSVISLGLTMLTGKIQATFRHERIKGMTDTLLFAGPLAFFIGTEQAYMLSDFLRAFVSCSLGISMVAGALIGMGIMQAIVSCTLSMLLRHVKRIVVILAGFFFHSCLLLALSSWKPIQDDTALFYVLAASWGACNGMWETLMMTLVTLNHTNHVAEVAAPLQGLRFLALSITFAAHGFMCEGPKIIILVILLVVSVPPYAMLETRLESQRKAQLVSL